MTRMDVTPDPDIVLLDPDGVLDHLAGQEFDTEADVLAALAKATSVINGALSGEAMPYQIQHAAMVELVSVGSRDFFRPDGLRRVSPGSLGRVNPPSRVAVGFGGSVSFD